MNHDWQDSKLHETRLLSVIRICLLSGHILGLLVIEVVSNYIYINWYVIKISNLNYERLVEFQTRDLINVCLIKSTTGTIRTFRIFSLYQLFMQLLSSYDGQTNWVRIQILKSDMGCWLYHAHKSKRDRRTDPHLLTHEWSITAKLLQNSTIFMKSKVRMTSVYT